MLEFLELALSSFRNEFKLFVDKNADATILGYCRERTFASLFVNGVIRGSSSITALQEYSTWCQAGAYGRPDIFFNYLQNAIWTEAKFIDDLSISEDHWNVDTWLDWDNTFAFQQGLRYYNWERDNLNKGYLDKFVMTLVFKKILNDPARHFEDAYINLFPEIGKNWVRGWYYDVFYLDNGRGVQEGIEVYGTFQNAEIALRSLEIPIKPETVNS